MEAPVVVNEGEDDAASSIYSAASPLASFLTVTVMLAIDELNPVKVLCRYSAGLVSEKHVAYLAAVILLALAFHQRGRISYMICRLFFRCTLNNMFFRSIEIVGLENLPKGPLILTGNHNNQFVDGVILLTNCNREISFMIAEKSYQRPFVGFLARAFHCIPVARPQDTAFKGTGKVSIDCTAVLKGEGTRFSSQVSSGCQLDVQGLPKPVKVKEVISDEELRLEAEVTDTVSGSTYKVLPKVDQSAMFSSVHQALKQGKCLGIFPEGGSHDRTDLLPLKAGVAIIALEAFSKHGLLVPIVPVGLNYFHGHKFGGRAVVEFGAPINVPESIYAQNEHDKKGATEELLKHIASGMRSVIVPVPNYSILQQIYMVRRLYVPEGLKLTAERAMDLNRRFAVGTFRIMQLALREKKDHSPSSPTSAEQDENPSQEEGPVVEPEKQVFLPEDIRSIEELRSELEGYMATLKRLGLRDHQVRQIGWWSMGDLIGRTLYLMVTMALGCIPQVMFNLPVWLIATRMSVKEQQKSLKASSVKLAARDVVLSYKIIYVLVIVPFLYLVYGLLIWRYSQWKPTTIVLALATLPFFSFLGMKASEQGVRAYTDIVPHFMRLLPSTRAEQDALPGRRAALQRRLHTVVRTFGPKLGDLYFEKEVDWSKEMHAQLSSDSFNELLEFSRGAASEVDLQATAELRRRNTGKKL